MDNSTETGKIHDVIASLAQFSCAIEIQEPDTTTHIPNSALLAVAEPRSPVSKNGQIAIGRKFAGEMVRAYVIKVED